MNSLSSRAELLEFFQRGHRPPSEHRYGLEYEMFVVRPDGSPVAYSEPDGVEELLRGLARRHAWAPFGEDGRVLGLDLGEGRRITLEPGAQLEFNSPPRRTISELEADLNAVIPALEEACAIHGLYFLGCGAQPFAAPEDIERIPKGRYEILEARLREAGELGLWMMRATCGIQVNFDHSDARDAAAKLRAAFLLAPVLNALFANSPMRAGEVSGYSSWRGHVWSLTDDARCGLIEACTRPDASLEDYCEWALHAPMLFVERGGRLVDRRDRRFADHLAAGEATFADWDLHLSTLFPEVRLRPQLELRSVDGGCPDTALALCALVKGIFGDPEALAAATELCASWSFLQLHYTWLEAHRLGLATRTPDGRSTLLELARRLLSLVVLPQEERRFLAPLEEILRHGVSLGEDLLFDFREAGIGDLEQLQSHFFCIPRPRLPGLR